MTHHKKHNIFWTNACAQRAGCYLYSTLPNKRTGPNKRTCWKILKKQRFYFPLCALWFRHFTLWRRPMEMKSKNFELATSVHLRWPRGQFATSSKYLKPPYQPLLAKMWNFFGYLSALLWYLFWNSKEVCFSKTTVCTFLWKITKYCGCFKK